MSPEFARIYMAAKTHTGQTEAEFYHGALRTMNDERPSVAAIQDAIDAAARIELGAAVTAPAMIVRGREMATAFESEIQAFIADAESRQYTGWSTAARARGAHIRFA